MARKPITYAHRRTRNKHAPVSQFRQTIANPEELGDIVAHSEMSRGNLKRPRQSRSSIVSRSAQVVEEKTKKVFKKPKLDSHDTRRSIQVSGRHQDELQTPHHIILTEEQVFKLEYFRGLSQQSDHEFSPVPPAPSLNLLKDCTHLYVDPTRLSSRKTSSRNLKENGIASFSANKRLEASGTTTGRHSIQSRSRSSVHGIPLASPFSSKPSSPQPLSKLVSSSQLRPQGIQPNSKRTLSDTHFNPNLPNQAQSTTNSPTRPLLEGDLTKARRPSAPSTTAQRPDLTSWFPSCDPTAAFRSQILSSSFLNLATARGHAVDFNRPPSQLSYNLEYDEAFFGDALEISTPFGTKAQKRRDLVSRSPDEVPHDLSSDMQITCPLSHQSDILGSWMSDSLISPPTLIQQGAYTQQNSPAGDAHVASSYDPVVLGKDSLRFDDKLKIFLSRDNSPLLSDERSAVPAEERPDRILELFDSLDLGFDDGNSRPTVLRTRSLDLEQDAQLQSPIRISPSKTKLPPIGATDEKRTGRDRRGTIRASDFPVSGSSTLGGPRRTRSGTVVQGPARPRRERSDTVVSRPSTLTDLYPAPAPSTNDVDMSDATMQQVVDVVMDIVEQDDELLLTGQWIDEDWVVAAPPSPIVPRRKKRGHPEWRKRFELKKASDAWTMEHDGDNGEDDQLLLK